MRHGATFRNGLMTLLLALFAPSSRRVSRAVADDISPSASALQGMLPVQKTVSSSNLRLVFFAGLEGTGHHYISSVFTKTYLKHPDMDAIQSCDIGSKLLLQTTMRTTLQRYDVTREQLRRSVRDLKEKESALGQELGTIVTVQRTNPKQLICKSYGELSYPNVHGPEKVFAYPDIQILAKIAEEEGVDFRVLYLHRSADSLLRSTISHRHFHNHLKSSRITDPATEEDRFLEYMRIILTDAGALHSSLSELGCGFITCHLYDNFAGDDQAARIADFLSPTHKIAQYLRESMTEFRNRRVRKNDTLPFHNIEGVQKRLQDKLDIMLMHACGPQCS